MRKNGVNRNITAIDGGICAPDGFMVGACACGIRAQGEDLALLLSDSRCPTAAVYADGDFCGASSVISKKHLRDGYARAVVVNGGIANLFLPYGEKLADDICGLVEKAFVIRKEDVLIASTGETGKPLELKPFEKGVRELSTCLDRVSGGDKAVRALIGADGIGKQLSFSFELGAFTCKIGALFKATAHVCPNMATTLVFLTTDVNISSEMLQKALLTATRETLNGINIDGISSPNDAAFIVANGKAGNYKIDCVDTEYKKFVLALQLTLTEICKAIISGLLCEILSAKSKQIARELAKKIVGTSAIKRGLADGTVDIDGVLYILSELKAAKEFFDIKIAVKTSQTRLLLFEDGKKLPQNPALIKELLLGKEIFLEIDLSEGNFRSVAFGCID